MSVVNNYKIVLPMKPFGKARPRCHGKVQPYMPTEYKQKIKDVQCQVNLSEVPDGPVLVYLNIGYPMPKGWSKAKKDLARGKFCPRSPDVDNVLGALMDAIFPKVAGGDSRVCGDNTRRYWSDDPQLEMTVLKLQEGEYYDDKNSL